MDPTSLTTALTPAFAAGFAVQRLLEILDPVAERFAGPDKKKIVLGLSSLAAGLGFAGGVGIRVLLHLGTYTFGARFDRHDLVDLLVSGLVISAGTEGFNSILKFMNYKKEESKAAADIHKSSAARNSNSREELMEFNSGDAMNVAYTSVTKTTGSTSPVDPPSTLDKYNVQDSDLPSIKQKILNNESYGLPHYQRSMVPNALNGLGADWTLQELADVIEAQSF